MGNAQNIEFVGGGEQLVGHRDVAQAHGVCVMIHLVIPFPLGGTSRSAKNARVSIGGEINCRRAIRIGGPERIDAIFADSLVGL